MRDTFLAGTPYETEIPPPPRPGAITPSPSTGIRPVPPGVAIPISPPSRHEDAFPMNVPGDGTAPSSSTPKPPSSSGISSIPAPPAPSVAPSAAPVGKGGVSLQVGAFRELKSAHELRNRLQDKFADVHISTTDSGGDPLYRVRVGRFANDDEANRTKETLQAAGFASFRVEATD
jgi:cell division protein FtsN